MSDASPADTRTEELRLIDQIWHLNEDLVVDALNTQSGAIDPRFAAAVSFFEEVTGLPSDTGTLLGRYPAESLRETLGEWNEWYRIHRAQLEFRPDQCPILTLASQAQ